MKKPSRAQLLLRLLPAALSMSSVATHVSAMEAPGNAIVSKLGAALQSGYLHDAQGLVDLMLNCGVRAVVIGDLRLTLQQLDLLITDLAGNDRTSWSNVEAAFQSVQSGAKAVLIGERTFVDEPCDDDNFPVGSQA